MRSAAAGLGRPFAYAKRGRLQCGEVPVEAVAKRFGTPLYVYSADQIRSRYRMFAEAFSKREARSGARPERKRAAPPGATVCYSVKANSNLAVLKLLAEEGSSFDIVSGGELERVLRVSRRAAGRVVFSGVGKTAEEMDLALRAGILIFNVESEGELELLAERARRLRSRARFAVRVNPDVLAQTHPYISTGLREHKFGVEIGAAPALYARAKGARWLEAAGVSVHIGSQIRSVEPFAAALARVVRLVGELRGQGLPIRYVDAGGGLGIDYHARLGEEGDAAAEVRAYADALLVALGGLDVQLLLEPGRFLMAQAGALVVRVLYVKANGGKRFVVTDGGMNDLLRPSLYQAHHEIVPLQRQTGERSEAVDVVGPVCETGDFFALDRELPEVKPGDLLAVLDAGAYGMALSSNYNTRGRAAEVLIEGRRARLVRKRERMEELWQGESG